MLIHWALCHSYNTVERDGDTAVTVMEHYSVCVGEAVRLAVYIYMYIITTSPMERKTLAILSSVFGHVFHINDMYIHHNNPSQIDKILVG